MRFILETWRYMRLWTGSALVQIMACCLNGAKPLSEPVLTYCQLDPKEYISMSFYLKFKYFHLRKCVSTCRLQNGGHFAQRTMRAPRYVDRFPEMATGLTCPITNMRCWCTRFMVQQHFRPEQNGQHFADDISKLFFLNENFGILIQFFSIKSSWQ